MHKLITSLFLLSSFAFATEYAVLQKISDGDTFTLKSQEHGDFKCRVYAIDTPEKFHTAKLEKDAMKAGVTPETLEKVGEASSIYAQEHLTIGKSYKVEVLEKEIHGRDLCILYNGERSYNESVVLDGYAVVYKGGKYIKDESFKRRLLQAQKEAKSNNRGLWSGYSKKIMESMEY